MVTRVRFTRYATSTDLTHHCRKRWLYEKKATEQVKACPSRNAWHRKQSQRANSSTSRLHACFSNTPEPQEIFILPTGQGRPVPESEAISVLCGGLSLLSRTLEKSTRMSPPPQIDHLFGIREPCLPHAFFPATRKLVCAILSSIRRLSLPNVQETISRVRAVLPDERQRSHGVET
ncbi:uncharacterized protein EI97DRAFT_103798 [Westerdykella ornata]|uniref:Uncharacterized protein n=1 Tax=Westerdykella ornata TaxID=318751 RepID=A0A6A6JEA8_WESOR|nr:uncharacterized protein EI97DRAFT_103798 [Westerdykella ornata]KAF2274605.1 hypothetical protein EI97DRAFT_103798 [Westerdykella ornata]